MIASGAVSCEAARAFKGRRVLSSEAPLLPLGECTMREKCVCVYRKYSDRRAGPRRGEESGGLRKNNQVAQNRRVARGRRSTDI